MVHRKLDVIGLIFSQSDCKLSVCVLVFCNHSSYTICTFQETEPRQPVSPKSEKSKEAKKSTFPESTHCPIKPSSSVSTVQSNNRTPAGNSLHAVQSKSAKSGKTQNYKKPLSNVTVVQAGNKRKNAKPINISEPICTASTRSDDKHVTTPRKTTALKSVTSKSDIKKEVAKPKASDSKLILSRSNDGKQKSKPVKKPGESKQTEAIPVRPASDVHVDDPSPLLEGTPTQPIVKTRTRKWVEDVSKFEFVETPAKKKATDKTAIQKETVKPLKSIKKENKIILKTKPEPKKTENVQSCQVSPRKQHDQPNIAHKLGTVTKKLSVNTDGGQSKSIITSSSDSLKPLKPLKRTSSSDSLQPLKPFKRTSSSDSLQPLKPLKRLPRIPKLSTASKPSPEKYFPISSPPDQICDMDFEISSPTYSYSQSVDQTFDTMSHCSRDLIHHAVSKDASSSLFGAAATPFAENDAFSERSSTTPFVQHNTFSKVPTTTPFASQESGPETPSFFTAPVNTFSAKVVASPVKTASVFNQSSVPFQSPVVSMKSDSQGDVVAMEVDDSGVMAKEIFKEVSLLVSVRILAFSCETNLPQIWIVCHNIFLGRDEFHANSPLHIVATVLENREKSEKVKRD